MTYIRAGELQVGDRFWYAERGLRALGPRPTGQQRVTWRLDTVCGTGVTIKSFDRKPVSVRKDERVWCSQE